jgi:hypothetical protein
MVGILIAIVLGNAGVRVVDWDPDTETDTGFRMLGILIGILIAIVLGNAGRRAGVRLGSRNRNRYRFFRIRFANQA